MMMTDKKEVNKIYHDKLDYIVMQQNLKKPLEEKEITMLMNAIDATELTNKSTHKQRQRQRNNNNDYAMSAADHTSGRGRGRRRGRGRGHGRGRGRGLVRHNKQCLNEFRQDCDWCREFRPDKSTYHLYKGCYTRKNQMDPEHHKYSECRNCKESDRKYIGHPGGNLAFRKSVQSDVEFERG